MIRIAKQGVAVVASVVLLGCGGGGGGKDTGTGTGVRASLYLGTWSACDPIPATLSSTIVGSTKTIVVIVANRSNGLSVSDTSTFYDSSDCTGQIKATVTSPAVGFTLGFNGTKTVGGNTVDKVEITTPANTVYTASGDFTEGDDEFIVTFTNPDNTPRQFPTDKTYEARTTKGILFIDSSGQLRIGNDVGDGDGDELLDSDGYPDDFFVDEFPLTRN
jgi:hypothetical protein